MLNGFCSCIAQAKLRSPDCRNKGFVLDGFPRNAEEARVLFNPDPKGEDDEEEEEEEEEDDEDGEGSKEPKFDTTTMVDFVVSLECGEPLASERCKDLPADELRAGHNDEAGFKRRWAAYQATHDPEADPLCSPLEALTHVEVLDVPEELLDVVPDALAVMSMYVEKKGAPYNYHPTPAEVEAARAVKEAEEEEAAAKAAEAQAEKERIEQEERAKMEAQDQARKAQVLLEDQELMEACSLPLRKYLMRSVIPALVDGLLETCKSQPSDPVDFLAEYLMKYSVGGEPDQEAPSGAEMAQEEHVTRPSSSATESQTEQPQTNLQIQEAV